MTYKELQKQARLLGFPYIGVSKAELENSINISLNKPKVLSTSGTSPTPSVVPTPTVQEKKAEGNTAIVYDGGREVRRYSLDIHGANFAELAKEFIVGRKYTVQIKDVKLMHTCPACGHRWND